MNKLTTLIIPLRYRQSQVLKSQGRRQAPCSVSSTTLEVQGGMKGRSDEEEHVCSLRGDKLTLRWGKLGFKICWVKYNHYTGSFPPIDRIVKGLGRYQNACCSAVTQSLVSPQRPCSSRDFALFLSSCWCLRVETLVSLMCSSLQ